MRIKKYLAMMVLTFCAWSLYGATTPILNVLSGVGNAVNAAAQAIAKTASTAGSTPITTDNYNPYGWKNFFEPSSTFVLKFEALGTTDIHVGLKYGTNNYIEILIGGWINVKSVVRFFENGIQKGSDIQVSGPAKPIPDTNNFVRYTLSVSDGKIAVTSLTHTGQVATVFSITNADFKKDFTAYSFRRGPSVTWYVKSVSAYVTPFVPGDIVAFKLADGCYLHSTDSTTVLYLSGVDQAVNIFLHRTHFEIVDTWSDEAGKLGSFTMKRLYDNTVATVDTAGFPRRLRIGGGPADTAWLEVNAYDAATKNFSFTAGKGLIVQRDRDNYEQRRQNPPTLWDYAAAKAGGAAADYTFKIIKIAEPFNVFYSESNVDSYATFGNQIKNTQIVDKAWIYWKAFNATNLVADDWWYLTRILAEYLVRASAFPEWQTVRMSATDANSKKVSEFCIDLLNWIIATAGIPQNAKDLAADMKAYLIDRNFSERVAFAGLTTRLAKLQKIEDLLMSILLDTNAVAAYLIRSQYCAALLNRILPQSTDLSSLTADEKKALQKVIAQAYYVCSKLSAADRVYFDLKKGPAEETANIFRALGFTKNSQAEWQIETISLILRKIAVGETIPATAADTVSGLGVFLARALMMLSPTPLAQQELNDYWKPGVTAAPDLAAKYLAAYYAGYIASSNATKNAVRDLTGCLIKIRGLITGIDSNNYPSLAPYDGAFSYVATEAEIPVDSRQAYFSTKDIPVVAGGRDPLLCVLRVNGRYLQFTGTSAQPSWGVAPSADLATQFKLKIMPTGSTWTTAPLTVELFMMLPSGEVPLRCVSAVRVAAFGLPTTDSPLRPAKAGTGSDSMSLKLVNPRYWLTGAVSQPTTQLNGIAVPKSSWLYELDGLHKDHSIFTAADPAKNQFFTTTTKGDAAPAGYVEAYFSFEPAPAPAPAPSANSISTAFLSIPPLESFIRTAKIDFILDEMAKVAHSKNPSEIESFKFARSGEILSKFFHSLTDKQQAKLLSSVLI